MKRGTAKGERTTTNGGFRERRDREERGQQQERGQQRERGQQEGV